MKIKPMYGWTAESPAKFKQVVSDSIRFLKHLKQEQQFDSVAYCGQSGAALAFIAGYKLDLSIICVRKVGEVSHGNKVESNSNRREIQRYIIVDDFIESGNTVRHTHDSIKLLAKVSNQIVPVCTGIYLYGENICPSKITLGRKKFTTHTLSTEHTKEFSRRLKGK